MQTWLETLLGGCTAARDERKGTAVSLPAPRHRARRKPDPASADNKDLRIAADGRHSRNGVREAPHHTGNCTTLLEDDDRISRVRRWANESGAHLQDEATASFGTSQANSRSSESKTNDSGKYAPPPRGILRGGSLPEPPASQDGEQKQSLRDTHVQALSRAKGIAAQIADIQNRKAQLDPQVEHYLKAADRPGISFQEKKNAQDKVRQLKKEQASQTRCLACKFMLSCLAGIFAMTVAWLPGELASEMRMKNPFQGHRRAQECDGEVDRGRRKGKIQHEADFVHQV
jgi:hypothetical protein